MEFYSQVQNRWLIALICGVIAISATIMFAVIGPSYSGAPALVVSFFSALGLLVAVLSVVAKEKKHRWAYVAIGLSLLPWFVGFALVAFRGAT